MIGQSKRILSLITVMLFTVSMFYSVAVYAPPATAKSGASPVEPVRAVTQEPPPPPPPPSGETGTDVNWHIDRNSTTDEWSWTSRNWMFGPKPTFNVYYSNGTEVTFDDYVNIGEWIRVSVNIPRNAMGRNATIKEVDVYGNLLTVSTNISANFRLVFTTDEWSPTWSVESNIWNYTQQPDTPIGTFAQLDAASCANYSDQYSFYFDFVLRFTSDAILGLYELSVGAYDTEWNGVWSDYQSRFLLAVGVDPYQARGASFGGLFIFDKLDMAGNPIYSVQRNSDFVMTVNSTGLEPVATEVEIPIPESMVVWTNVTDWYEATEARTGGWVYDPVLGTYVWNSTVTYQVPVMKYGTHPERQKIYLSPYKEIQINRLMMEWNNQTNDWDYWVETINVTVSYQIDVLYNHTSGTWSVGTMYSYEGYRYDHYVPGTWNELITVREPYPADLPVFYELNESLCSYSDNGRYYVVDFVGHFTDAMPKTEDYPIYLNVQVTAADGMPFQVAMDNDPVFGTFTSFEMARKVAIETPVTIANILNPDGTPPEGWMMHVNKGSDFIVEGTLQGGGEVADDIDGVKFTLQASTGEWSENESVWTDLDYVILCYFNGTVRMKLFNYTTKWNLTYGLHWDWVEENATGWHYEYNESADAWQWVYGNYTMWNWKQVEDWYWAEWFYNQLTGEWVSYFPARHSRETEIQGAVFATVSNFTKQVILGDLYASFEVNLSDTMPESEYWWDFSFVNLTWYEDETGEWGLHEVYSWEEAWVYSFDYGGDRVYMTPVEYNKLAYVFDGGVPTSEIVTGYEQPYIVIDGQEYLVKTVQSEDFWTHEPITTIFFYDHWDHESDTPVYYYELLNGTKIPATYTTSLHIYNVTVTPGESFLTGQEYEYVWEYGGQEYYSWIDIYGNVHQSTDTSYQRDHVYNFTLYDKIVISPWEHTEHQFVRYGLDSVLDISRWWWSSRDECYYMTDTNGTLYRVDYDTDTKEYYATIDGTRYRISAPEYYWYREYNSQWIRLVDAYQHNFWYYEKDGIKYEMPYPGAGGQSDWDLNHFQSQGGVVPTKKSLMYNDTLYPVHWDGANNYVTIDAINYTVTELLLTHATANGTDIWDPQEIGKTSKFGTYDDTLTFTHVDTVAYDAYLEPYDNKTNLLKLLNGTVWVVNSTQLMVVFEYLAPNGTTFLSTDEWPTVFKENNISYYVWWSLDGREYKSGGYDLDVVNTYKVELYHTTNDTFYYFDLNSTRYYLHEVHQGTIATYVVLNATYSGDRLYMVNTFDAKTIYNFTYMGTPVNATAKWEAIYRRVPVWGHPVVYGPEPIRSTLYKNVDTLVYGAPDYGLWGLSLWTTDPETGALDLDGDLNTQGDQYYVLEVYSSTNTWSHEWEYMDINLMWDVNGSQFGDEMFVNSWMGVDMFAWSYKWNETFYWYHASDMSPVNSTEMTEIRNTVLSPDGEPAPGYWGIAWMVNNVTWDDILAEAQEQGWDWISEENQTWTWLSFGIDQSYGTSYTEGEVEHWLGVGVHYEFSGLMIWEDDNNDGLMQVDLNNPSSSELTHYLIPDSVDAVDFVTPGYGYGDYNDTGHLHLNLTDEVTWGVTFFNVTGTVFPFSQYGYWDWYAGVVTGSDLRTFDERPTRVTIDELSFLVHFCANVTEDINNHARIKVDNYVGNWDVDLLGGRRNLENRSLALNYFSEVNLADFAFKANGSFTDTESTVAADTFQLETAGARFAEMIMGGTTYDWGKNLSAPYDVVSYTTPLGTFEHAYESDNGMSATAWSFSSSMYMVSIGFPEWDGYSVYQDPVFISYVSSRGTSVVGPSPVTFGALSIDPALPTEGDTVTVYIEIYSTELVDSVTLYYSTDGENWQAVEMSSAGPSTYTGSVPPFPDGTTVYLKVGVSTASGYYESQTYSYTVGRGGLMTTETSIPTTGGSGIAFGGETTVLLLGVGAVLVIIVVLVLRRRR